MSLNLEYHKEWAKIARSFKGRTQHQIKNRFFCLLAKNTNLPRNVIRQMVNENQHFMIVYDTLSSLKEKIQKEFYDTEKTKSYKQTSLLSPKKNY